jgi:hypothetical protein
MSKLAEVENTIKDLLPEQISILENYLLFINTDPNKSCQHYHKALEYLSSQEISWDIKQIKPNFGETEAKIDYADLISKYRSIFFHRLLDNNAMSSQFPNKQDYVKALFDLDLRKSIGKVVYLEQIFNMSWNDFVSQSKDEFEQGYSFQSFYNITVRAYRHCAKELGLNENL